MIDVGLNSLNPAFTKDILAKVSSNCNLTLNYRYIVLNHIRLSVCDRFSIDRHTIKSQIFNATKHKLNGLSCVLRLDNRFVYAEQLVSDKELNDILQFFNENNYYVIYTNDLVKEYITKKYSNIRLIISEYRYTKETIEDFVQIHSGNPIEINSSVYEDFIPYIEYGKIKPEDIWVTVNKCVFCDIRNTCVKSKSFCRNHKGSIIDIYPSVWKYHIGYKSCYSNQKDLSFEDILYRLYSINKRGITKFLIESLDFDFLKNPDNLNLFIKDNQAQEILYDSNSK